MKDTTQSRLDYRKLPPGALVAWAVAFRAVAGTYQPSLLY